VSLFNVGNTDDFPHLFDFIAVSSLLKRPENPDQSSIGGDQSMIKINRLSRMKIKMMATMRDHKETADWKASLLNALIEDELPEDETSELAVSETGQVPELPQGAVASLPEPAKKIEAHEQAENTDGENQTDEAEIGEENTQEPGSDGDENKAA